MSKLLAKLIYLLGVFFSLSAVAESYCAVSQYGNELECFDTERSCQLSAQFLHGHCNVRYGKNIKPRGVLSPHKTDPSISYFGDPNTVWTGPKAADIVNDFCAEGCLNGQGSN